MKRVFTMAAAGVVMGTLLAETAGFFWLGELASHFPVQALVAAFITLPVMARDRRYGWVAALLVAVGLNAVKLLPYMDRGEPAAGASLVVAAVNLNSRNQDAESVVRWLGVAQPAVVAFAEVNPRWERGLQKLEAFYPHALIQPEDNNFGIALLSRLPIRDAEKFLLASVTPAIAARIQTPQGTVEVIAVHLRPPITPADTAARDAQLQALAQRANQRRHPLIVLGDFNTTPFSPKLQGLLASTGLIDAAQDRGIGYTWPLRMPWFRIPIDLCLVSPELRVDDQFLGPDIGSDHWPLVTELGL